MKAMHQDSLYICFPSQFRFDRAEDAKRAIEELNGRRMLDLDERIEVKLAHFDTHVPSEGRDLPTHRRLEHSYSRRRSHPVSPHAQYSVNLPPICPSHHTMAITSYHDDDGHLITSPSSYIIHCESVAFPPMLTACIREEIPLFQYRNCNPQSF